MNERELATRMEEGLRRYETAPPQENLQTLAAKADWLDQHSSAEAIDELGAVIRRATGAPQRAYAPAASPPPGEFVYRSMLPYSTKQVVGPDGVARTEQTWVDRDGRTLKQTRRRETAPDGTTRTYLGVYQPDGSLFESETQDDAAADTLDKALETVAQSPLLQRLFSEAVLPTIEARRNKSRVAQVPAR